MFKTCLILLFIIRLNIFYFWMVGNNLTWNNATCIIKWLLIIHMILHSRWRILFIFLHLCSHCLVNSLHLNTFFCTFFLFNKFNLFFSQSYYIFKNLHFFKWLLIHIKPYMTLPCCFFFLLSFLDFQEFLLILKYIRLLGAYRWSGRIMFIIFIINDVIYVYIHSFQIFLYLICFVVII